MLFGVQETGLLERYKCEVLHKNVDETTKRVSEDREEDLQNETSVLQYLGQRQNEEWVM